jgi:hypothetical protein
MNHHRVRALSCAVFIAISASSCYGSSFEQDVDTSVRHTSYLSTLTSSISGTLFSVVDNFKALVRESCQSAAKRSLTYNGGFHQGPQLNFFNYNRKNSYHRTLSPEVLSELRKNTWASKYPMWLYAQPQEEDVSSVDSFSLDISTPTADEIMQMLKKATGREQTQKRVVLSPIDMEWSESHIAPQSKDEFDALKASHEITVAQMSTLEAEHQKTLSVLKQKYAEKEIVYLQKINFLEEQLHAVLIAYFVMPTDFDPDVYLALHPHVKEHTQSQSMTEEQARVYATHHYQKLGGPIELLPYKEGMDALTPMIDPTPTFKTTLEIPGDFPEDLKSTLFENPELVVQASKYGLNLETYTRQFLKSLSTDQV